MVDIRVVETGRGSQAFTFSVEVDGEIVGSGKAKKVGRTIGDNYDIWFVTVKTENGRVLGKEVYVYNKRELKRKLPQILKSMGLLEALSENEGEAPTYRSLDAFIEGFTKTFPNWKQIVLNITRLPSGEYNIKWKRIE